MKIAILNCKGTKQNYKCSAEEMYSASIFFSRQLQIVKSNYDSYYILSSKYGLITPDTIIEPYDLVFESKQYEQRLTSMGRGYNNAERATTEYKQQWGKQVAQHPIFQQGNIDMWIGNLYFNLIKPHLPKNNNIRKVQVNSGKGINKMKGMLGEILTMNTTIDELISGNQLKTTNI
jgi:hypothetical protein